MKKIDRYENETIQQENREAQNRAYFNVRAAYMNAIESNLEYPLIDTCIWDKEAKSTACELKEQGFEEILYVHEGSNAMNMLMIFQEEGYKIDGMRQICYEDKYGETVKKTGFVMKLIK